MYVDLWAWLEKGLGRNMFEELVTKKFGKEIGAMTLNGKKTWRYLWPLWMLTTRWTQQRRILIIKWLGWPYFVDTCQPLSSAISVVVQWVHEPSGQGGRNGSYAGTQQDERPLTKAKCWVNNLSAVKTNTQPLISYPSPGDWPATWQQIDYTGLLPLRKEQHSVLTEINTYTGYGFAFPACKCSKLPPRIHWFLVG